MTFSDAVERRVLCGTRFDTVLALGGSASYLSSVDITAMRQWAKGPLFLMHYAIDRRLTPPDLRTDVAGSSLDAAAHLASFRTRVGRFAVTVIA